MNKVIGKQDDRHRLVVKEEKEAGKAEPEDPEVINILARITETVWAKDPYDVGQTLQHNNVVEIKDPQQPAWKFQYKIREDAEEGISDTITGLLKAGVLERTTSEWNTPIYQYGRLMDLPGGWYTI